MSIKKKQPRTYRRITPATIANTKAQMILSGNGTAAIRDLEPEYKAPAQRAHAILNKPNGETAEQYIENGLQQIATPAVQRLGELVNSDDEQIATRNVHYVIDHLRGKAVQRSITATVRANIETVLD